MHCKDVSHALGFLANYTYNEVDLNVETTSEKKHTVC